MARYVKLDPAIREKLTIPMVRGQWGEKIWLQVLPWVGKQGCVGSGGEKSKS